MPHRLWPVTPVASYRDHFSVGFERVHDALVAAPIMFDYTEDVTQGDGRRQVTVMPWNFCAYRDFRIATLEGVYHLLGLFAIQAQRPIGEKHGERPAGKSPGVRCLVGHDALFLRMDMDGLRPGAYSGCAEILASMGRHNDFSALDAIVSEVVMPFETGYKTEPMRDDIGRPRLIDRKPSTLVDVRDPSTIREPRYLYRAVSEEEWQLSLRRGYLQSDQRMNLADEGTVASLEDPSFYLPGRLASHDPGDYPGRILRLRYDDSDGWKLDRDGYVKTHTRIPIHRIEAVSPKIITRVNADHGRVVIIEREPPAQKREAQAIAW